MDAAGVEHSVDTGGDQDEKGEYEVDHLAAALACGTRRRLRRVLVFLRDFKMCVGLLDAPAHGAEIAPGPDDEEHEQDRQPRVEVKGNGLQEQHESVDRRVLGKR